MSFIILYLSSCQTKFDKEKWNERTDPAFPSDFRTGMLKDLTNNHKLVGLQYSQLIDLLGIPDTKDSAGTLIKYYIKIKYQGIEPVYTKNLEFTISKDSIVKSYKVVEWKE